jgi:adenylate cyclase
MEIERKYLVPSPPERLGKSDRERISQGYLAIGADGEEVRVRRAGERAWLTVKRGLGEVRVEEEIELDPDQVGALWPLTEGRRITKTRHRVPEGDFEVEVDVFEGELEGLVTAEVEFESDEQSAAFEPPEWFGDDVTEDARYKNERLATAGLPG